MDISLLFENAEALSKQSLWLVKAQNAAETIGYWGGNGMALPVEDDDTHWMSFDCSALPEEFEHRNGWVSIYESAEEDDEWYVAREKARKFGFRLRRKPSGTPLKAVQKKSLPPVDALVRFGNDDVRDWLQKCKWTTQYRDIGHLTGSDRTVAEEYKRLFDENMPISNPDVYAVLGGWHVMWPEGDWEELLSSKLVAFTIKDAEPWLEVWLEDGEFRVIARIT